MFLYLRHLVLHSWENFIWVLATISFISMGTGVTLVDGLDGLARGVATLALIGLSVAALPICSGTLLFLPIIVLSQSCNPMS